MERDPRRRVAAADDLDLARTQHVHPQRLAHRLLGAEPDGEVLRRPARRRRVRALAVGEQAVGQPGAPFERPFETVDLQEGEADHGVGGGGRAPLLYSTVTVLARLRGWSTFSPRRRAIR